MKKILCLSILALVLFGCGGNTSDSEYQEKLQTILEQAGYEKDDFNITVNNNTFGLVPNEHSLCVLTIAISEDGTPNILSAVYPIQNDEDDLAQDYFDCIEYLKAIATINEAVFGNAVYAKEFREKLEEISYLGSFELNDFTVTSDSVGIVIRRN
jgi:hypothetical protein